MDGEREASWHGRLPCWFGSQPCHSTLANRLQLENLFRKPHLPQRDWICGEGWWGEEGSLRVRASSLYENDLIGPDRESQAQNASRACTDHVIQLLHFLGGKTGPDKGVTPPKSHGKLRLKLASCNHQSGSFELGRSYRVGKPGEPGTKH